MRGLLAYSLMLFLLAGCNESSETTSPIEMSLQTESFPAKLVQCVFTYDYDDMALDYDVADVSNFEDRLGLLSGFDLSYLRGELPGVLTTTEESGLSAVFIASYADCDTTNEIVNILAEKYLKTREYQLVNKVNRRVYLNLAKESGISVDKRAFVEMSR